MDDNYILHSGVAHDNNPPGRGSGRYGWGTGMDPKQGNRRIGFLEEVDKMTKEGFTPTEIAKALLGPYQTSVDLKAMIAIEKKKEKDYNIARARKLYETYNQNLTEVSRRMNKPISTISDWLKDDVRTQKLRYDSTAEFLKKKVEESPNYILDVSEGVELSLGVPKNTKDIAIAMLQDEGYVKTWVKIPRVGDKSGEKMFNTQVLVKQLPGETLSETITRAKLNKNDIGSCVEFTPDRGEHFFVPEKPRTMKSDRIFVRYAEDGGLEKDGLIELRKGVDDLNMNGSHYAQIRINVEDTHYIKGMGIMSDDIPDGYDIVINTNKKRGVPLMDKNDRDKKQVLKPNEIKNPENPFGATIIAGGQSYYSDPKGDYILDNNVYRKAKKGEKGERYSLSYVNKVRDEGDWQEWSKTIATQFLSKQPLKLIEQQIDLSLKEKKVELEKINSLTNPIVKKKLLNDFAGQLDSNAADLKVTGFKNQAYQVILPIPELSKDEVYAPNYKDGEKVALVRFPHAGPAEIPICTVKNKGSKAEKVIGKSKDAIGINPDVASQLSGADFDGDTVMVIPMTTNKVSIQSSKYFDGLIGFDTKQYALPEKEKDLPKGKKYITYSQMQQEMGKVTNLITDMTAQGATIGNVEKAVKHSMVVIDSFKHKLDYKQSEKDNDIAQLKKTYQMHQKDMIDPITGEVIKMEGYSTGAGTIFSRSNAKIYVDQFKEITRVSDMTPDEKKRWDEGKRVYRRTGKKKYTRTVNDDGTVVYEDTGTYKQSKVKAGSVVDDMTKLIGFPENSKEWAYANYGNELKKLANQARKEARSIETPHVNKDASIKYAPEVESLTKKLENAEKNKPRERAAHRLATTMAKQIEEENPAMDDERRTKLAAQQLTKARQIVGAHREPVVITDKEWEAIANNALSAAKIERIFLNTDQDKFRERATPKNNKELSTASKNLIKSMLKSGRYTNAEIAEALGVSVSTINNYSKEM